MGPATKGHRRRRRLALGTVLGGLLVLRRQRLAAADRRYPHRPPAG